ncbi:MAG: aminopeptidase, partial [Proteobacteria bacterium]|nr:aminopeptidase [Pseudomonadota bacterium]
ENYQTFFDQRGKPILWVLTAAERYRLKAVDWHFPVIGSFTYIGYFDHERGQREEAEMRARGYDTELGEVAAECRALGAKVVAEQCDVADGASVKAFVDKVQAELGTVHVALNNAVYRVDSTPFLEVSEDAWEKSFRVNLGGPRNICRAVLPMMIKQRWGRIINFSGIDPLLGGSVVKGMAKLGIVGFTRGIAREFAEHEITANCIGPGTIDSEREKTLKPKLLRPTQPIRRMGTSQEVVSLMLYLASEDAGFVTGQNYLMNGGMYFQ